MKLKVSVVALGLTVALAQPAFATEQELTTSDLAFAFQPQQTAQPRHIAALSQQEMKETEGAWVNYAIGAGVGALWNGYSYAISTHDYTWQGWVTSIGSGAIGGAIAAGGGLAMPFYGGGITALGSWAATQW